MRWGTLVSHDSPSRITIRCELVSPTLHTPLPVRYVICNIRSVCISQEAGRGVYNIFIPKPSRFQPSKPQQRVHCLVPFQCMPWPFAFIASPVRYAI